MKIRMHRGGLDEALATAEEIEPTTAAVLEYLARYDVKATLVDVKPYGYDPRINWNTHIIIADGLPAGWTDGPIDLPEPL